MGAKSAMRFVPISLVKHVREVNFSIPGKLKGTFLERSVNFWKNLYMDYHSAITEGIAAAKEAPRKTLLYATGCGLITGCAMLNPDERSYRDQYLAMSADVAPLPPSIRNPLPVREFVFIEKCFNEGTIHRFSFGIMSIMWFSDNNDEVANYEAKCSYLQPPVISFPSRILDVGFLGTWWRLSSVMEDYDINPEEFSKQF